jgi:hypothetical protein
LPEPVRLVLPTAHARVWSPAFQTDLAASEPYFLFQARAPPSASPIAG